jgi:hypothetical protein
MNRLIKNATIATALFFGSTVYCLGQASSDSLPREYKNNIRVNITNPMLFGDKYTVVGYERKIKEYQTASVNIGRFAFPKLTSLENDSLGMSSDYSDKGFTMAFDYRFYLKNENKHQAPRGVYMGPYYSFNYLGRKNTWVMDNSAYQGTVNTDMSFTANLVGVQLGYQFILWKRLSLDMILFGPGVWFYKMKIETNSDMSSEALEMLYERINTALAEKLPGHEVLLPQSSYEKKGSYSTKSGGYRLMMHLGFLF